MPWAIFLPFTLLFLFMGANTPTCVPTCAMACCHPVQGGQGFEIATEQSGQPASQSEHARDSAGA